MTTPPTEIPLARAEAHLQAGRLAEAAGAYRAVLLLDPTEARAHLGLAECALARGSSDEAVEGLVRAAAEAGAAGAAQTALHLLAGALMLDPTRLELHLEVAELEIACGLDTVASARLRALASAWRTSGRTEDADALDEFVRGMPSKPLPSPDMLVVALPEVDDHEASPPSRTAAHRALRRRAVRWSPGGSPGRRSVVESAEPPPPPPSPRVRPPARPFPLTPERAQPKLVPTRMSPPVKAAPPPPPVRAATGQRTPSPKPASPRPKPVAVPPRHMVAPPKPAPSPLAQRLRTRSGLTPTDKAAASAPKQRLASRLAEVTAKHRAARARDGSVPAPSKAALDAFEEARTQLFQRQPLTVA